MNVVQTRFKCKLDVKRCKRFVFPPSSLLPRSNALKTKAIRYFQTDRTLTRIVSPPLQGWLHLAHGVRGCAAGLRYVLYLYMTSLEDPTQIIAEPAGYFMAPIGEERIGDVSNVLFSNGWIEDDNGKVYIYYASSDTRLHVAESTVSQLVDYCLHTPTDGFRSIESVKRIITMVNHNKQYLKQ